MNIYIYIYEVIHQAIHGSARDVVRGTYGVTGVVVRNGFDNSSSERGCLLFRLH